MCDDVQIDVLSDYLHALEKVRGNRTDDDAVVVLVERLDFGKVSLDCFVFLDT